MGKFMSIYPPGKRTFSRKGPALDSGAPFTHWQMRGFPQAQVAPRMACGRILWQRASFNNSFSSSAKADCFWYLASQPDVKAMRWVGTPGGKLGGYDICYSGLDVMFVDFTCSPPCWLFLSNCFSTLLISRDIHLYIALYIYIYAHI